MTESKPVYSVVIIFTDNSRRQYDFTDLLIFEGCLILTDPKNEIPREVHCFPLASVRSFIFDFAAIDHNATNVRLDPEPTSDEQ